MRILLLPLFVVALCHGAPAAQACWPPRTPQPPGCPVNPVSIPMTVGVTPVWFTADQLPLDQLPSNILCTGFVRANGAVRYFVDGTAPSATVGSLVPPLNPVPQSGPQGTLDYAQIVLYNDALVRGFKTVSSTSSTTTIDWVCKL